MEGAKSLASGRAFMGMLLGAWGWDQGGEEGGEDSRGCDVGADGELGC